MEVFKIELENKVKQEIVKCRISGRFLKKVGAYTIISYFALNLMSCLGISNKDAKFSEIAGICGIKENPESNYKDELIPYSKVRYIKNDAP